MTQGPQATMLARDYSSIATQHSGCGYKVKLLTSSDCKDGDRIKASGKDLLQMGKSDVAAYAQVLRLAQNTLQDSPTER